MTKGHIFLFNHFIDMRTTFNLSISCRKKCFCWKRAKTFQTQKLKLLGNGRKDNNKTKAEKNT